MKNKTQKVYLSFRKEMKYVFYFVNRHRAFYLHVSAQLLANFEIQQSYNNRLTSKIIAVNV